MVTVNEVKRVTLWVLQSYKAAYKQGTHKEFIIKYIDKYETQSKYCLQVSTASKIVGKILNIDSNKVKELLKNSTTNNLPKVKYIVKRKGSYCSGAQLHYYYLGDIK